MASYYGGQIVKGGFYLKPSTWEFESVIKGGSILPGGRETRYIRVPLPAVMVAGPLAGLAFIIFLPSIGIVGIIGFLTYRGWQWVQFVGRKAPRPAVTGLKVGIAYLTKRGGTHVARGK